MSQLSFTGRLLATVALLLALVLLWVLREAWLLLFAAVLVAVLLTSISDWLRKHLPVGHAAAFALSLALLVAVVALTAWLFGREVAAQFEELGRILPGAIASAEAWLRQQGVFDTMLAQAQTALPSAGQVFNFLGGVATGVAGILSGVGLAVVGGIYLATDPRGYVDGFLMLWPRSMRPRAAEAVQSVSKALRGWLLAQAAAMMIIGTLTTIGLWAIGSPSFLALGLIAGIVQFIPLAGPLLAAIPALLVALSQGPEMLIWTAVLYVAIQQLEGNLITPMVQKEVAALPPAVTIFTLVIFGLLFGAVGVVLAVPLTVVAVTLVGKLWVRDTLGEDITLPGESK